MNIETPHQQHAWNHANPVSSSPSTNAMTILMTMYKSIRVAIIENALVIFYMF